jgi:hypothetical protein
MSNNCGSCHACYVLVAIANCDVLVHSLPDDPGASCGPKPITTLLRHKEKKIGIGILKILSSSRFELKQTAVLIAHDLCLNAKNRRP